MEAVECAKDCAKPRRLECVSCKEVWKRGQGRDLPKEGSWGLTENMKGCEMEARVWGSEQRLE